LPASCPCGNSIVLSFPSFQLGSQNTVPYRFLIKTYAKAPTGFVTAYTADTRITLVLRKTAYHLCADYAPAHSTYKDFHVSSVRSSHKHDVWSGRSVRHFRLDYRITADDWHALKATRDFLEPFWQVTLQKEGKDVTIDEMQTTMDFIVYYLQRSEEKYAADTGLLAAVNTCWYAFNKWYERIDEVPAYVTAALLHPSKRLKGLRKSWTQDKWIKAGLRRAEGLW
jgi:hypothetical protein